MNRISQMNGSDLVRSKLISPLDGRYFKKTASLNQYFSEWALMKYRIMIEVEWLITLSESKWFRELRVFSPEEVLFLRRLIHNFDNSSVRMIKDIEKTTNHDVKAVEYYLKNKLKETTLADVIEFVHFCCTSDDINNLSYALMLKNGINNVWVPQAKNLIKLVSQAANKYKNISMLSHTHGQRATPTTVGKEVAVFVYRWTRQLKCLELINYLGKFNGAVGNFNAHHIAYPDLPWEDIAKQFVEQLGLIYNPLTTQIEPHDYMAECFHAINRFNNITLNFNRDMWLYISLGYLKPLIIEKEIGSSTMPHKVNPINFETSEANIGLSNAILNHLAENLQVSRLQRDLSDSSLQRNIGSAIAYSCISMQYAFTGFKNISVDGKAISDALSDSWEVLGEAIQMVMRKFGHGKPYEMLKIATREKKVTKEDIARIIKKLNLPEEEKNRLLELTPEKYVGIAPKLVDWIEVDI